MELPMFNQASSIAFGSATLVLVYTICYQVLRIQKRSAAVLAFALAVVLYVFLVENLIVLHDAQTRVGIALIELMVSFVLSLRIRYKKKS
jgi:putative flippase GtrA